MFITDTTHYVMKMLGHVCTVAHAILAQLIMNVSVLFGTLSPQHRQSFQDLLAGVGDPRHGGRSDRLLTRVGDV